MNSRSATESDGGSLTPKDVGESVSGFELPGAGTDGIEMFSLSEFTDEGGVVLSFYSFDFNSVCADQLCRFRDAEWLALAENVDVFGISVDSAYSHQAFREKYDLNFPLLSDRVAEVAERFGIKHETLRGHQAVSHRAVFAIDETDTIRYRWIPTDPREHPSPDELRESIDWVE